MGGGSHGGGGGSAVKPIFEGFEESEVPWWTSKRFMTAVISFMGFAMLYAQRVNLSIAMVCMINHTASTTHDNLYLQHASEFNLGNLTNQSSGYSYPENHAEDEATVKIVCPGDKDTANSNGTVIEGEFVWDKGLQGILLGSFFYGYLVLQIPGGWLSEHLGAKKVIAFGMYPVAILTILTPFAAWGSPYLLMVVRIVIGIGESVMYPSAQALFARWAPPWERSRLIGFSYAGGQFGNAMAFPLSSLLCEYGFHGGWPSVFYVLGILGLIWCIVWTVFVHDSPADSPGIKEIEKMYIQQSLGRDSKKDKDMPTPWKAFFTSMPVWAIIVGHACGNFGAYMLLTNIPAYMKEVLHFDIKKNGAFSMLPYLAFWAFINLSGTLADFLIERKILSVVWTRKMFGVTGLILPGVFLIICGYMECTHATAAVVLLTFAVGFSGLQFAAYFVNHGDIAPPFAGTLFGISNTAATIPGILAPYMVGAITVDKTREQWLTVFYITAGVHLFGAIFYLIFAKGEIQEWAKPHQSMEEDVKEQKKELLDGNSQLAVELKRPHSGTAAQTELLTSETNAHDSVSKV